jgi:hypothetical protein
MQPSRPTPSRCSVRCRTDGETEVVHTDIESRDVTRRMQGARRRVGLPVETRAGAGSGPCRPTETIESANNGKPNDEKVDSMLYTIAVVLLILWLCGLVSSYTLGGFIHVLLVIAVIMILVNLITGRRSL